MDKQISTLGQLLDHMAGQVFDAGIKGVLDAWRDRDPMGLDNKIKQDTLVRLFNEALCRVAIKRVDISFVKQVIRDMDERQ